MTTVRQIARCAAVLLAAAACLLPPRADATIPRSKSPDSLAMLASGSAPLPATTCSDVYLNDKMAVALFDQLCRNDPVNNFAPGA